MRNVKPGHIQPIVCLDAGHYGKYNRSPAVPAYYESEMNWKLHNYLAKELEGYGIQVKKTRAEQEYDKLLYHRGTASEGSDLFLSIHSNAVGSRVDEAVDYVRIYHLVDDKSTAVDDQSKEVAKLLLPAIVDLMEPNQGGHITTRKSTKDLNDDGVLNDNYYTVLHGARQVGTAGLILEHSFHTNTRMTLWLMEDENLRKLAKAEAKVIAEYFGMEKTAEEPAEAPDEKPAQQPEEKVDPAETCTVTLPIIRFGDTGEAVRAMQTLLALRNHPCPNGGNDGIFGKGTKTALEAFQSSRNLPPDAICGPLTWAELVKA